MLTMTEIGVCPECASTDFTLCEDVTTYTRVRFVGGDWSKTYDHEDYEEDSADPLGSRRLMCVECGSYIEMPQDL